MEHFENKGAARLALYLILFPLSLALSSSHSQIHLSILAEKDHRVENKNKPAFRSTVSLSILAFPFNLCLGKARASKRLGEKEGKERAPLTRKWRNNEL